MTKLRFQSLDHAEQNFAMLDLIPDTHAWIKDTAGAFVYGNPLFYDRFGFSSLQGLLGKCDFDLAPAHLAERYVSDDAYVLGGGVVTDRLEMINAEDGSVAWFLTSKWPVFDLRDRIIGTFGISRHLNPAERKATPFRELREPIDYISQHFAGELSVQALAQACNISVSALERRFRKHLKKTPHQYINEVRLDHAQQLLLETEKSIGTIALETGFADHSHFTRAFSRHFNLTPSKVRQARARASDQAP
jgi:AraC-like DNA-binding protein